MTLTDAPTERARALLEWLTLYGDASGPLLILTHDHPDPDSLASAWALAYLAARLGAAKTMIRYGGAIGRAENQAMAERLKIPAKPLGAADLDDAYAVALVDTQPAFENNSFPPGHKVDLVIDHHPRHPDTTADLVIIDDSVGATATILGEALELASLTPPKRLATALVYGIGSETQDLGRESGPRDAAVYHRNFVKADPKELWRIERPRRPAAFFENLARGLHNAFVAGEIIGVHLGPLLHPDPVAELADFLLTHEGMRWALVTGRYQGNLHLSLRAVSHASNAGKLIKRLLREDEQGGGHRLIAGGKLPVGLDADEATWRAAEAEVLSALLKLRGHDPDEPLSYPFRVVE